ncbi:MAG: bifunctional phosphopantothenoylcysteine decarboxylase/phosphopantothenate--cysteine ligase CoaBC [Saprospiraceae bacterium]|nr:bifunctional phosphopantothenoylcysteine decarboxylase/phosphopantothenate--cysteine ligase CoaBC [Saprospiraceae bacterium]
MLQGKKILLGLTGSIAAYKSASLCRLLIKEGCEVKVVMTEASADFITPLTLATLSGNPVMTSFSDGDAWNNHVEIGLWADIMLIAPATATSMSKMAHGMADNILVACYLSAKCPVFIAPAMDLDMWKHKSTINNVALLKSYGNQIIPVGHGFLASGLEGDGRMAEPEEIITLLKEYFAAKQDLSGQKVLITAGPTFEAIDPVRYIGNRSSGKMGLALAEVCAAKGAMVTLILGPISLDIKHPGINVINVESSDEMFEASDAHFDESNLIILAAAVADYKAAQISPRKMKKSDNDMSIHLVHTTDIAATLGARKKEHQILVGFALETNDEKKHASQKLHKKNLDFIVINSLNDLGAGFQYDTNKISILDKQGNFVEYALKTKKEVAVDIIDFVTKK